MQKIPRKSRDILLENALRKKLGEKFKNKLGAFSQQGECWLVFPESGRRILCKYSSFYREASKWFWGVSDEDWKLWSTNDLIALMLEDDIGSYSFILLNSHELKSLLEGYSTNVNGQRQINMRIYKEDGSIRFQENKYFDVKKRKRKLCDISDI